MYLAAIYKFDGSFDTSPLLSTADTVYGVGQYHQFTALASLLIRYLWNRALSVSAIGSTFVVTGTGESSGASSTGGGGRHSR